MRHPKRLLALIPLIPLVGLLAACGSAAATTAPSAPTPSQSTYYATGGAATQTPWTGDGPQAASHTWYAAGYQFGQQDAPGSEPNMVIPECDSQLATNPDGAPMSAAESWWKGCVAGESIGAGATPAASTS
jgi:hypothetical protein